MLRILHLSLIASLLAPILASAQTVLHTKTRDIETDPAQTVAAVSSPNGIARGHLVLQFRERPTAATVAALKRRGIRVLGDVPDNGLLVSLERPARIRSLGAHYAEPIHPYDKISPLASSGPVSAFGYFLVDFHPDADMNQARGALLNLGILPVDNPDLHPRQLMIHLMPDEMAVMLDALSALDPVAYIFPASHGL